MGIYVFRLPSLKGFHFKKFSLRIISINIMIRFSFGVFFCAEMGGGGVYVYAEYTKQQQFLKEKWGIGGT